ncbi:hypothetical protein EDD11_004993 [Mortierella claussenii]|nr:hypothetical protein EDD11_004993 [Mortierella claussenii]
MRDTRQDPVAGSVRPSLVRTALLFLFSAVLFQLTLTPKRAYWWSNIKNLNRSLQYHGQDITSDFFEGWYFKMVKEDESTERTHAMAIVVGIYRPPVEAIDHNRAHAFVIPLGLPGPEKFAYYRFKTDEFLDLGKGGSGHDNAFRIRVGNSLFAHDEVILDLPVDKFERISAQELESFYATASSEYETQFQGLKQRRTHPITKSFFRGLFPSMEQLEQREKQPPFAVQGHFKFPSEAQTPLPTSRIIPTIMGITHYLPFLECNHGVASLHHPIQHGRITTLYHNGSVAIETHYDGGVGYIEKDWGINFPSSWIWTQTNVFKSSPGSSMMISIASVPLLGPDVSDWVGSYLPAVSSLVNFPGMLIVYYHRPSKTLYNFSTYMLLARVKHFRVTMDVDVGSQTLSLLVTTMDPHNMFERISMEVNVTREMGEGAPLRAPSRFKGRMFTAVEETLIARTQLKVWRVRSGEVLVEDEGLGSGLEIVGDIPWLENRINPRV